MAADPDGVSSGSSGDTRRADCLRSLPRAGDPTATSRMSRGGSSSRRSETSGGAACLTTDTDGMGKQMVRAEDAVGGRGGHYLDHSSPSYGSRAASSGGGGDASSFVAPRKEEIQGRLFSGADFIDTKTPEEDLVPSNVSTVNNAGGACTDVKKHSPISLKIRPSGRPPHTGFSFDQFTSKEKSAGHADTKDAYHNTLTNRDGQGPYPPPFYKCEACCKRTAFYRFKCCHLVVCDHCGCNCGAENVADKESQFQKGGKQINKEQLPKVKFQGTDLFLWQPFSYPADLMLCLAKRTGYQLQYYFAPIDRLMDPSLSMITTIVYSFHQAGRNTRSLKVTEEVIWRNQLH